MRKSSFILKSFIHAAGTFMYICGVALIFFNAQKIFGETKSFLIPVMMLTLFVLSASITGLLVLGRPMWLYLDGHKKEAVTFLFATLGWLAVFLLTTVAALLLR